MLARGKAAVARLSGPDREAIVIRIAAVLLLFPAAPCLAAAALPAQTPSPAPGRTIASIEQKTAALKRMDGFFPLFWDEGAGQLLMEIPRLNTEVLHVTGLASGLGSNDIGLDRGALAGSRIVTFERVGPRVLLVQPNYRFRADSDNPAEVRAVRDAFARSVLWSFNILAETSGSVLVDITDFVVRDSLNMTSRLRPGSYRFDAGRSTVHLPGTLNFPKNTEIEAELTFVQQSTGGPPQGGAAPGPSQDFAGRVFFEGVGDVAAAEEAASLRVHQSFVELPDDGYRPRRYDPRSGYIPREWEDRALPLGQPLIRRVIIRHRLNKVDPRANVSDPVKPIVYYLDPGAPEPIRSALLEGARWWNQAFEAAGYRNAFRVEMLPEGAHPLDIRYNVINWVHRSTRGWSTGGSVADPRTGEIIKGVVTLGSLRIRQDYLLAEGLLAPYVTGTEAPRELADWALARIKQLSAHEVGHTLGLSHNFYDSDAGRISVMDYPHPLITLKPDRTFDYSTVYAIGIGEWDKAAIVYGYQHFPEGTPEEPALTGILDAAWKKDVQFMTNEDMDAHPRVDWWSNGTDATAELLRMMEVRRIALGRFGENVIRRGTPMAQMEEVLVPLFLHHRYQVEATASILGGQYYVYAMRGDGREPLRRAPANEQRAALEALLTTLKPSELRVPDAVLKALPPRPQGWDPTRELFPRYTGPVFDAITPAVVAAQQTVWNLLDAERAARMVEQHALDPSQPGLDAIIEALKKAAIETAAADSYEAEIKRAVERVIVERLMDVAARARMPQVRAIASRHLQLWSAESPAGDTSTAAHRALIASDIKRFLERPSMPAQPMSAPAVPPGAPIGQPPMDWLDRVAPPCSGVNDRR